MRKKNVIVFSAIIILSISTVVGCSIPNADDSIGFTVSWIDYDDNEDGNKDRIDMTLMTRYYDDVYVIVDAFIDIKVWDNEEQGYTSADFITHHHESFNTAGNGEGYVYDFRPEYDGQFQITIRIFMNNTLKLTEVIDWQGWKSDITEGAQESTWTDYDKDNDGFKDTISINFLLKPNTTGMIDVEVNTTAYLLDEEATNLTNVVVAFSDTSQVNSTLGATISVNITLNSPLTGDLILDNKILITYLNFEFELGLNTILWENAHRYADGPLLSVKAINLDLTPDPTTTIPSDTTTSSSEKTFILGLKPLDGSALLIVTFIASIMAILLITGFERRK